jgi:hypothetical protein
LDRKPEPKSTRKQASKNRQQSVKNLLICSKRQAPQAAPTNPKASELDHNLIDQVTTLLKFQKKLKIGRISKVLYFSTNQSFLTIFPKSQVLNELTRFKTTEYRDFKLYFWPTL